MDNQKICRICCENTGATNVFQSDDGVPVSVKIMYCCKNIRISDDDGLPTLICDICKKELEASYNFVLKCEASDKKLRLSKDAIFNSFYSLKEEIKKECEDECDNSFNDDTLEYPLDNVNDNETTPNETENVNHIEKKNKSNSLCKEVECQCSVCGRFCASNSILITHMRTHTNDKPYHCQFCDKKYKEKGSLKRHKDSNHHPKNRSRNFICESCGKAFFSKNDVKIHLRTHTGETPYICNNCPMKFTQISAYLRHQKRHSGVRSYSCSICNKKFCTKDELKMHSNVHSNEKKYSCPICSSPFKYRNNLKKHLLLHSQPKSFVCNHCGRTFNVKGNLKIHIDRIHSPKSGYCSLCSKNVANMEVHMWRHSGERPLKCEQCSSSFYDVKALAHHINFRHKNKEKHKCTYDGCTMAFPTKPMLDFHKAKLHETGIPFPCDRCSRGFYRKNDLARHKIGTHKERLL